MNLKVSLLLILLSLSQPSFAVFEPVKTVITNNGDYIQLLRYAQLNYFPEAVLFLDLYFNNTEIDLQTNYANFLRDKTNRDNLFYKIAYLIENDDNSLNIDCNLHEDFFNNINQQVSYAAMKKTLFLIAESQCGIVYPRFLEFRSWCDSNPPLNTIANTQPKKCSCFYC